MKKIVNLTVIMGLLSIMAFAKEPKENIYTKNCLFCHDGHFPSSLERMFMSYIKVYSGEATFKASLMAFLKKPDKELSVMSDMFLDNFNVKKKTKLNDEELKEAIDIYWDLYNVRNKLK